MTVNRDELIRELLLDPAFDNMYEAAYEEDEREARAMGFCSLGCTCNGCRELHEDLKRIAAG